jgi:hypothetical protein
LGLRRAFVLLVGSIRSGRSASRCPKLPSRHNDFDQKSMGIGQFQSGIVLSPSVVLGVARRRPLGLRMVFVVLDNSKRSGRSATS